MTQDQDCSNCKHMKKDISELPCKNCFNTLLWFIIPPTNWEPKRKRNHAAKK